MENIEQAIIEQTALVAEAAAKVTALAMAAGDGFETDEEETAGQAAYDAWQVEADRYGDLTRSVEDFVNREWLAEQAILAAANRI